MRPGWEPSHGLSEEGARELEERALGRTHTHSLTQTSSEHVLCANHLAGPENAEVPSQSIEMAMIPPVAVTLLKTARSN